MLAIELSMKIDFITRYVEEGSLELDEHGRWRIDIYIFAPFKVLPEYKDAKELYKHSFPVVIGSIFKKGSTIGNVASTIHEFSAKIPSFENCLSLGYSEVFIYDNDLDSLKQKVVNELNRVQNVFKYAK